MPSMHTHPELFTGDGRYIGPECAWCGADLPARHTRHNGWTKNRRGETFCCRAHRVASNRALLAFRRRHEPEAVTC